jgi:hypothetical protein
MGRANLRRTFKISASTSGRDASCSIAPSLSADGSDAPFVCVAPSSALGARLRLIAAVEAFEEDWGDGGVIVPF